MTIKEKEVNNVIDRETSRCPRCGKKIDGKQTRFCTRGIEINAEHTCEIIELFKQLREVSGNECY